MQDLRIPVPAGDVGGSVFGSGPTVIVLGHGAGGNRRTPQLVRFAESLAASDRRVLLYDFPYTERGRRAPDPPAVLEATTRAVGDFARASLGAAKLVHGGKSMGGRIASQVVAAGAPADGLVFLGYPLHPPGKPGQLRDRHLPQVDVPMLFVQGTRDTFARPDLLAAVLERLGARATLHQVEGGDHSFAVPKSSGRTGREVEVEVARVILGWLDQQGL
ncbi:MAG: alpha/beta fold hydrolase [Solirubrobacterales bacterium]